MRISYVVPVHNEEQILRSTVEVLVERLGPSFPGSQAILVENGSSDGSRLLAERLAEEVDVGDVKVVAAHCAKGFGNAYRHGMTMAHGDLLVLTAADLPFGFSDLDAYLALGTSPPLAIGSKAHPASFVEASRGRRVVSWIFRLFRRWMIKLEVGDTQGTILIEGSLAHRLLPHLTSEDYFVSTEIIALAASIGTEAVELPIVYSNPRRGSKVRPFKDGMSMGKQLFALRGRLRSQVPVE